jgi:DNA-binding CsgD family transcriptional regulator
MLLRRTRYPHCVVEARTAVAALDRYGLTAALGSTVYANLAAALVALARWSELDSVWAHAELLPLPPQTHRRLLLYRAQTAALRGDPNPGSCREPDTRSRAPTSAWATPTVRASAKPRPGPAALLARAAQLGVDDEPAQRELAYAFALTARWTGQLRSTVDACRSAIRTPAVTAAPEVVLRICAVGLGALAELQTAGGRARRLDDCPAAAAELVAMATSAGRTWSSGLTPPEPAALHRQCQLERAWPTDPDPGAWAELTDRWRSAQMPHHAGYAGLRHSHALLRQRDRRAAATVLRAAHHTAAGIDAEPLRRQIERLARRGRLPLGQAGDQHRPAARADNSLTRREHEVLELLTLGRTNRQIAATLLISERTAGVHVSHILAKLGAGNRTEASRIARDLLG